MYVRAAHVNVTDVSIRDRHGAISEGPLLLSERARDHDAVGRSGGSQQETESHGQGGPTHSAGIYAPPQITIHTLYFPVTTLVALSCIPCPTVPTHVQLLLLHLSQY